MRPYCPTLKICPCCGASFAKYEAPRREVCPVCKRPLGGTVFCDGWGTYPDRFVKWSDSNSRWYWTTERLERIFAKR